MSFGELLDQVRGVTLGAYEHQDLPFEKLVAELDPQRDPSRSPLFQVCFTLQNAAVEELRLPGLLLSLRDVHPGTSRFDLTIWLREQGGRLTGLLEYSTDLFDRSTVERLLSHYAVISTGALENPQQRLSELSLLALGDRHQLLAEWNATRRSRPEVVIHELFESQVATRPEAVAIVHQQSVVSYGELACRSGGLARRLGGLGVGPEVRVALCLERRPELVLGALGILKAGGAYVPLDPAYPEARIRYMLEDARVPLVVSESKLSSLVEWGSARVVEVGGRQLGDGAEQAGSGPSRLDPKNLAYVLYTSGSTGRPKGVALTHRGAVNLICWAREAFRQEDLEGMVGSTSICFDVSVFEIFAALAWGGKLVLTADPLALAADPNAAAGRLVSTVPSAMGELLRLGMPRSLGKFFLGGEPVSNQVVQRLYEEPSVQEVLDGYGPSEDSTYTTSCVVPRGWASTPRIGRPAANKQVYVFNRWLDVQPIGVVGELAIGGAGLARGYLDRPRLTAERFVPHPFSGTAGERLYRTGDLSRVTAGGEIDFLGRFDHQVKVRGFRIELGEIEAALEQDPAVEQAIVMARGRDPDGGDSQLVGYLVAHKERSPSVLVLRELLSRTLPAYMVPASFVILDGFPLTPSGKVDRRALPAPDGERPELQQEYVAPGTPTEDLLARIWEEVLGVTGIGARDNFFDLGGNSLLLVQVHRRLLETVESKVTLIDLFNYPTVSGLAGLVAQGQTRGLATDKILKRATTRQELLLRQRRARPLLHHLRADRGSG
jgi:amino acid adenylation domain-containing protein